jgi:hypothetical protein
LHLWPRHKHAELGKPAEQMRQALG